jgi:hypothetical protein
VQPRVETPCIECGKVFVKTPTSGRKCSACFNRLYRARAKAGAAKACVECGKDFQRTGRLCVTCDARKKRARQRERLGGQNLYEAALGDPVFLSKLDTRIANNSVVDPTTECRVWTGKSNVKGYGTIGYGTLSLLITRLVAIRAGRAKVSDPETLHSCDNPSCLEPEHLSGGTHAENMHGMARRGRQPVGASGLRGVSFRPGCTNNPWLVSHWKNGRTHYCGCFPTAAVAASFLAGVRKHQGLSI